MLLRLYCSRIIIDQCFQYMPVLMLTLDLSASVGKASQWRIQDFLDGGHQTQGWTATYYLAKKFRKLHESERNWTGGDVCAQPPLDPCIMCSMEASRELQKLSWVAIGATSVCHVFILKTNYLMIDLLGIVSFV